VSFLRRLVVAALPSSETGGVAGGGTASPSVGTTGTLLVSSGKGFDSAGGFCGGWVLAGGFGCCAGEVDCACSPTAAIKPHAIPRAMLNLKIIPILFVVTPFVSITSMLRCLA